MRVLPATPVAALALLLAPVPSLAQREGTVRGTVTRKEGHQPLRGATVSVVGTVLRTVTNPQGQYVLRVRTGDQVVRVAMLGYRGTEAAAVVAAGATVTVDLELEAEPVILSTVVVQGPSRIPETIMEAPAAVNMVEPETARNASITGQTPLALSNVPGIDLVQSGVTDFNVNARGFNTSLARSVLVLQDGRDISVPFLGSQEWLALSLPAEDLDRIEFVRGPGSALYGANAFNGVIAITTPPARDVVGTKVTLGGGELTSLRADVRLAGVVAKGRLGYRANLGYSRSASWTRSRTRFDRQDFAQEYGPATDSVVNPPPPGFELVPLHGQTKDPLTGQALGDAEDLTSIYGSGRLDYYVAGGATGTLDGGAAQVQNEVFMTAIGRVQVIKALRPWARMAWTDGHLNLSAWYSGRVAQDPQVLLVSGLPIDDQSAVLHTEGQYRTTFLRDRARLALGASLRDGRVNTKGTLLDPAQDDRSDLYYAGYGQLEYDVFPSLRLVGAVRWDQSDLYHAQVSPKGAIVFRPTESHALRFSVNRAFLTPSQVEFFLHIVASVQNLLPLEQGLRASPLGPALAGVPQGQLFTNSAAVPVLAQGNPDLIPEKVTSYEVGYKGQLGRRLFVTVDGYRSHLTDFVTTLLPAPLVNPAFQPWSAPSAVPPAYRAALENAVRQALAGTAAEFGLTRLTDGSTAIALSYGNAGLVDEWGLEVGSNVSVTDELRAGASYTFFDFDIKQQQAGDVLLPNTPGHKGSASLSFAGRQGFDVGVQGRFVSGFQWASGVNRGYVPSSQTIDVNAGFRVSNTLWLHAVATNILDQQRFHIYGGSVVSRRIVGQATITF